MRSGRGPRHGKMIERLLKSNHVRHALSELGVFARNLNTGVGFSNSLWKEWGYTDRDLNQGIWIDLLHPDDRDETLREFDRLINGEISVYHRTYRIRTRNDEWRWVQTVGAVVTWNRNGSPGIYLGADVDITERKETEEALAAAKGEAEEEAQEAEALRMAGAIVASTLDVERTVQLVLDQAYQVVPYDTATVQLLRDDTLAIIGGSGWEDIDAVRGIQIPVPGDNPHTRAIQSRNPIVIHDIAPEFPEFSNISGNDIRSWIGVPLTVHGETIGLLALDHAAPGFFTAKHVRLAAALGDHVAVALYNARLYEQTRELAMTDSLTGIATRRSFFVQAEHALEQARRNRRTMSLLMADLDLFKEINDQFGHAAGDEAIRQAAAAAIEVLRRADIIGRYGGEEFAVVLPETESSDAVTIAERLRARVSTVAIPGRDAPLTISVGVTSCNPAEISSIDEILEQADRALYAAKANGRNRVEPFKAE